jgi:hypothetical protein
MKLFLLQSAGVLHFLILIASSLAPRVLDWRGNLAALPTMLRRLFWVYGASIVLVIIGFGALTLAFAPTLAAGSPLARGFCGFVAAFWLLRLIVQLFVFDLRPYLTNRFYWLGYQGLTAAFIAFVVVYGLAAAGVGWR